MAITLNSSAGDDTEGASTTTNTVTTSVAAGSNRCAFMGSAGNSDTATEHSMTFDGDAMSELIDTAPSPAFQLAVIAHLKETDNWTGTGNKDAVDTWTTSARIASSVIILDGVDQTTPVDTGTLTSASTALGGATSIGPLSPSVATGNKALTFYSYVGSELTDEVFQSGETIVSGSKHYDGDGFYGCFWTMKDGAGGATDVGITSMTSHRVRMVTFEVNAAAAGGSTTVTPTTGLATVNGRAGTVNSFSAVAIREVLINEAGSPVTNRTGIQLLVWYAGNPTGAPDLSYSALTTDADGTASWSLAPGGLTFNQVIFYVATDGGASLSQYTCARMTPTYS